MACKRSRVRSASGPPTTGMLDFNAKICGIIALGLSSLILWNGLKSRKEANERHVHSHFTTNVESAFQSYNNPNLSVDLKSILENLIKEFQSRAAIKDLIRLATEANDRHSTGIDRIRVKAMILDIEEKFGKKQRLIKLPEFSV